MVTPASQRWRQESANRSGDAVPPESADDPPGRTFCIGARDRTLDATGRGDARASRGMCGEPQVRFLRPASAHHSSTVHHHGLCGSSLLGTPGFGLPLPTWSVESLGIFQSVNVVSLFDCISADFWAPFRPQGAFLVQLLWSRCTSVARRD